MRRAGLEPGQNRALFVQAEDWARIRAPGFGVGPGMAVKGERSR